MLPKRQVKPEVFSDIRKYLAEQNKCKGMIESINRI